MVHGNWMRGVIGSLVITLLLTGCGREQSDWEKARASNNTDSYESFIKKYPSGAYSPQAQARLKELYEEREWQKARDADTPDAYQTFLKQFPEGKWAEEARIRVENFSLAQAPAGSPAGAPHAPAPDAVAAVPAAPAAAPIARPVPAPAPVAAPAAKAPAAAQPPPVATKPHATGAGYGVQLGAYAGGPKAADRRWAALQKKHATALKGLTPKVHKTRTAKGVLYRLQVTGLTQARALAVCKSLKASGDSCVLVKPAGNSRAVKKARPAAHRRATHPQAP